MTEPVSVIAEAGVNHNGDLSLAIKLCDAAKAAGADAVKFQSFRAEDLVMPGAPTAQYQAKQTGEHDQFSMLRKLELSREQHVALRDHCAAIGIEFFSTPFSTGAVDMLVELGARRLKLPSGELTHRALVEHAARTQLPLLMSTGMASLAEVREALDWARGARGHLREVVVMHCTSAYPAPDESLNLRAVHTLACELGLAAGYSDHSLGIEASLAAVALGAIAVEKHLTLDRTMPGPDHAASLEPAEFGAMVAGIRRVSAMLGDGRKEPRPEELDAARVARRSIVAAQDIAAGTRLDETMLAYRRPATGIAPGESARVAGKVAREPIAAGTLIRWDQLHD